MILIKTTNYAEAIEALMDLSVKSNTVLNPVPRLKNALTGSYLVGVDQNTPFFKYHLNISKADFTLEEVRVLETNLQTKLVG